MTFLAFLVTHFKIMSLWCENTYPRFNSNLYINKAAFRDVDALQSPNRELLKIIPECCGRNYLSKLEAAEFISPFLNPNENRS